MVIKLSKHFNQAAITRRKSLRVASKLQGFLSFHSTASPAPNLRFLRPLMASSSPDLLFGLRNNFHIGAYQAAINNSDVPNLSTDEAIERDSLVYRSYIALGSHQQLVIDEVDSSAPTALQAVKLLAIYLSGNKESAISSLWEWLSDAAIGNNPVLRLVAGIIYMHEQDYNEALKHTNAGGTMELLALNVQIYIKMHRSDYAEKQLKLMQQIDEDHTLTQLASAWFNLAVGGSKIQEAYLIYQDFSEKYQMTGMILNGKAVCCMHMGRFDEAETLLLEALNKDAKDAETLANLVVCSLHVGKSASRYLSQLKLTHPDHVLIKRVSSAEDSFDRAVQSIA
ncbi:Coatomer subunit epsilon-1 [Dendrobium catenatum]|uniref:Coatomer subunit epsilon-1 n=1 Tax=Dendrobium catenatum TaxID=906689 RepID=A0A2I0V8G5_9ASPA|nr:Coatomer subunit epsilon-1 [Dendrobium catenatum]